MQSKKAVVLLLVALTVAICPVFANVVTLDEALQAAKDNNISLSIAQKQLEMELRNAKSTASSYIPSINLTGAASVSGSFIDSTFNGVPLSASIGASVNFTGDLWTKKATNNLSRIAANLSYASSEDSIEQSVIGAYWNLSATDYAIKSALISYESAQRSFENTESKYENGLASELSYNQAKLAVTQASYSVKQLEDTRALALSAFRLLTGITDEEIEVEELPETIFLKLPSVSDLFAVYSSGNLDLRTLRNSLDQANLAVSTTKNTLRIPTISLSAQYSISSPYFGNNLGISSYDKTTDSAAFSVGVTIPLDSYIPGSSGYNSIKSAEDSAAIAMLSLRSGEYSVKQGIESAVMTIAQAEENLKILESTLELYQYTYELTEEAYESGLATYTSLSEARDNLLSAELNLLNAKVSHLTGCYDLSYILAVDLADLQEAFGVNE